MGIAACAFGRGNGRSLDIIEDKSARNLRQTKADLGSVRFGQAFSGPGVIKTRPIPHSNEQKLLEFAGLQSDSGQERYWEPCDDHKRNDAAHTRRRVRSLAAHWRFPSGNPTRRRMFSNLGSPRSVSNLGNAFMETSQPSRSVTACSSQFNASSVCPSPS